MLIPMEEIMDYLRIYDYQEESLLAVYREAAINFAESYTNRFFGSGEIVATFKKFLSETHLPLSNLTAISSVSAYNENGELEELTGFRFNEVSESLVFTENYSSYSDFQVKYTVFNTEITLPPVLKIGMLKLIATWYENREDISNGVSVQEIPLNHKHCFDLFRLTPTGV